MRIVGGRQRGTKLFTPEGSDTRPTTDRARESLFNVLAHGKNSISLDGARVADVFAGTGAVGLEALSRGAAHCSFVENGRPALKVLEANIRKCRAEAQAQVMRADGLTPPPAQPFDLVFVDPPYHKDYGSQSLAALVQAGWVAPGGMAVVQIHPRETLVIPEGIEKLDERKYGSTLFHFLTPITD